MSIKKCYDAICKKENMSCFVDCNSMFSNALILKELHDKLNKYENMLDDNKKDITYNMRKDFQKKFNELCDGFENKYNKIIEN